jgi:hypothetical protein
MVIFRGGPGKNVVRQYLAVTNSAKPRPCFQALLNQVTNRIGRRLAGCGSLNVDLKFGAPRHIVRRQIGERRDAPHYLMAHNSLLREVHRGNAYIFCLNRKGIDCCA